MLKWFLSLLVIVLILTLALKYSAFISDNAASRKEDSVSLAEVGKIIKDIRIMNSKRKEDIKEQEKQLGDYE